MVSDQTLKRLLFIFRQITKHILKNNVYIIIKTNTLHKEKHKIFLELYMAAICYINYIVCLTCVLALFPCYYLAVGDFVEELKFSNNIRIVALLMLTNNNGTTDLVLGEVFKYNTKYFPIF